MTVRENYTMNTNNYALFRTIEWMLKDYLHKLERDDRDWAAVEKMKEVNFVLDQIKED